MALVSARMSASSDGETSGAASTLAIIGGMDADEAGALPPAAKAVDASSAMAVVVAISIMSAIDGRDRQKFDVRNREERTVSNVEIDRDDVLAEADAELRDGDVPIVRLIRVERRAIRERDREARVVRPRRS